MAAAARPPAATRIPPSAEPASAPRRDDVWLRPASAAKSSGLTSWRVSEALDGSKSASHMPKAIATANSSAMLSPISAIAMIALTRTPMRAMVVPSIRRRGSTRSASTPPTSSVMARGTVLAVTTRPATAGEAVVTAVHATASVHAASPASDRALRPIHPWMMRSRAKGGAVLMTAAGTHG